MAGEMDRDESFDFDASTAQAWSIFAERLAEVVSMIDDGESFVLGTTTGDPGRAAPFVSFTCGQRRHRDDEVLVLAQTPGNEALDPGYQLAPAQQQQLVELGWHAPQDAGEHPGTSYWAEHVQDDCTWLAELAVATLRDVLGVQHPVFLAPDQLAEVLSPEPTVHEQGRRAAVPASAPHDEVVRLPASRAELLELVREALTQMFGHEPIADDEDDFAIRVGSSMVFVRCSADAREVLLFSALVHDLEGRGRAVEVLNDLNAESRFGRFSLVKDRVFVSMSLLARPFVAAHLREGVQIITQIADALDDELATKLRGRVTFTEGD